MQDITEERGFVLKKDLSNLDIDDILKKKGKFKFEYNYPDVKDKWKEIIKPFEKKDIKFSIIIPNYNNAKWLDKCLTSVLEQTYKNYEVIFIDDMSTDNSMEIAETYKGKIKDMKIIKLRQKRYNGGARNEGILEATGDYIVCLDSDDWIKHNKVLELLNTRIRNEDVIFTGFDLSNGKQEGLFPYIPKMKNLYEAFIEDVCACWTKVIKASIFKETLFPEGTLAEDRVWHYRLIDKCNKFSIIQESTHVWNRANTHSTTTDRGIEWEASCIKHLAEMYKFIKTTKNEEYKKYVNKRYEKQKMQLDSKIYQQL